MLRRTLYKGSYVLDDNFKGFVSYHYDIYTLVGRSVRNHFSGRNLFFNCCSIGLKNLCHLINRNIQYSYSAI